MKSIRKLLVRLIVLGAGAAAIYKYGLSDEAKEALSGAASTLKNVVEEAAAYIQEANGQVVEDQYLPNRDATLKQWEHLGY